jgi:hypothetical protein
VVEKFCEETKVYYEIERIGEEAKVLSRNKCLPIENKGFAKR